MIDEMEEEDSVLASVQMQSVPTPEPILLCRCLLSTNSSEEVVISERKKLILSTVARTENYLRERRIPELIRFLLTKLIADTSTKNPVAYMETLLDKCMLFRAGHGVPPVLYENRHLEAVVKSFDPGQRMWLSAGQVRRAFTTLGLTPEEDLDERIPTDIVLNSLRLTQERELLSLLSAGTNIEKSVNNYSQSTSTI